MSSECTVTIQDVFNRFYPEYERSHKLSAVQRKAAYHIMNCKTVIPRNGFPTAKSLFVEQNLSSNILVNIPTGLP